MKYLTIKDKKYNTMNFLKCFLILLFVLKVNSQLTYPDERARKLFIKKDTSIFTDYSTKEIKNYPYRVSIQIKLDNLGHSTYCGGSIISLYYVITSTSCLKASDDPKSYIVRSGSNYWNRDGLLHDVDKIIKHNDYEFSIYEKHLNNIGLIKVKHNFEFGPLRQPIKLLTDSKLIYVDQDVTITGWFLTEQGHCFYSKKLQMIKQKIVNINYCKESYDKYGYGLISNTHFCAGTMDTCTPDNGGSLVIDGKLAGIQSWGFLEHPGVYTEIPKFIDWIKDNTCDDVIDF